MDTVEKFETGSTNDDAKLLAERGAAHLTVVWAHQQISGRGRQNRRWISPNGNVYWSVIVRTDASWPEFTNIAYVNALAVREAVEAAIGAHRTVSLKWPNDILINSKKLGGSLIESGGSWVSGRPEWAVIGTGVNVTSYPQDAAVMYPATSLHKEGYLDVSREHIIDRLRPSLEKYIKLWSERGFSVIREMYLQYAHNLGCPIRVGTSSDKADYIEGTYVGINEEGGLILQLPYGGHRIFRAADIIYSA